jgi:hypothetical protein
MNTILKTVKATATRPVSVTCNGNVKRPKDVAVKRNGLSNRSHLTFFLLFVLLICIPSLLEAKVGGICSNCHTMHNSQNGQAVARGDAAWGGSGGDAANRQHLLVASCIGCHSSTGSSAIEDFSGGKVPIVFNTGGYPDPALAGGNFYYVSLTGSDNDAKGHNIFSDDVNLNEAPGRNPAACYTNNSCHANFHLPYTGAAVPDSDGMNIYGKYACEGCHLRQKHHADDHLHLQGGIVTTAAKGWYRFLSGHLNGLGYPHGVDGYEDGDWEYTSASNDHNEYLGNQVNTSAGGFNNLGHTTTAFCTGCHTVFHDQSGITSPFTRHPADVVISDTAEYTNAFGAGGTGKGTYDPLIPVARSSLPDLPDSDVDIGTDMVMCLSCHRAHGSQYYKMLRWDYKGESSTLSEALSGCNKCHTSKN